MLNPGLCSDSLSHRALVGAMNGVWLMAGLILDHSIAGLCTQAMLAGETEPEFPSGSARSARKESSV